MPNPPAQPGKKIAGINRTWWIVGGAGAAFVVWHSYHKAATTTDTSTDPTAGGSIDPNTGVPYASEYYSGDYSGISGSGAIGAVPGTSDTSGGAITINAPATNQDWFAQAEKALTSHGYTAAAATAALTQYLLGLPLTSSQLTAVEAAIHLIGPTPTPITAHLASGKPLPPSPAPKPGSGTKQTQTSYTVKPGDTLSKIAAHFHTTWQKLYAANKKVIGPNPNVLHVGTHLIIP